MRGATRALALAGLTLWSGAELVGAPRAFAANEGVDLLERAEEAAREEAFAGVLVVEWHDGEHVRSARVDVESAGGVMRFGDQVVGTGAQRLVRGPEGWLTVWGRDVIALGPSPTLKYVFSVGPGSDVAGRATRRVEVRLRGVDQPRERLYLDRQNGLLLRRELLNRRGRVYRSVGFVRLSPSSEPPIAPLRSTLLEPLPAGHINAPFDAPKRLGVGYRLVGAYERPPQDVVHLFYSDGLHGLSVFEQRGRLNARTVPAGSHRMEVDGQPVRAYLTSVGQAAVWEGDGIVYTVVSDAPFADVAAAVSDLPHEGRDGRLRRVAEVVVSLFRWR